MEMDDWSWGRRVLFGTWQCVGLGMVAAALEAVVLAASLALPLTLVQFLLLGVADMIVLGVLAALLGVLPGMILHLGQADDERGTRISTLMSLQIATCSFLLCGWFLWQGAVDIWVEGQQPVGAIAMALMPLGFAGVVYFNARFWLRKLELGRPLPRIGWVPVSAVAAVVFVVGSAVAFQLRDTGGTYALEGDKNVLIVTVDGLRRDEVGALGGPATPALDGLASDSATVTFTNAVTPSPESRAADATVLTGLHPLRLKVLDDRDALSRAYRPLAEILDDEDYATGAFVSSRAAAASSGLSQGFRVYDDDFGWLLPGFGRLDVVALLTAGVQVVTDPGKVSGRDAGATIDRLEPWLDDKADVPFFAWVHLADPHRAAVRRGDYPAAVQRVDEAVGRILALLDGHGLAQTTLVMVVGSHGELLGAHGGQINRGLYDEVVRVPLLVRAPGTDRAAPRVDSQVRLMDVAPTAVDWLGLDELGQTEGVSLVRHIEGRSQATIWCALVGRSIEGEWLIGLRNNGVKYVRYPDGTEELYDVEQDPAEATDLSDSQDPTVAQARTLLASDRVALEGLRR